MEYNDLQKSLNETPILIKKQNSPHNWLDSSGRHHSSLINYPCEKSSGDRIIMDIKTRMATYFPPPGHRLGILKWPSGMIKNKPTVAQQ